MSSPAPCPAASSRGGFPARPRSSPWGVVCSCPSLAQLRPGRKGPPLLTTCHFWVRRPNGRVSMSSKIAPAAAERAQVPGHIAIIMDGNGRWAKQRGLPRIEGHRRGVETVRTVTFAARDLGVRQLSLYAFSTENWNRPADEVGALMGLL